MKEPVLHGLFPTPVIFTNIEREFTKEELEFFDENGKTTFKNEGNVTSLDNYLMKHDAMSTIKQELTESLQMFLDNIIKPKDDVKPYITQSWLNFTSENQFHHKHAHPNSFLSGVMYIDVDSDKDQITFFRDGYDGYKQIRVDQKEFNLYNSDILNMNVKSGDIVIFPSSLQHGVEPKIGKNIRVSLSFNTFLKGAFGTEKGLTELNIA